MNINWLSREINFKIVYYGPGLGGKTTNLEYIYQQTKSDVKGKLISLKTGDDRTLFFDFLPLSMGEIKGFSTRLHLYTVPAQVFYNATRKLVLRNVDGVIIVLDSQRARREANLESVANLQENLMEESVELKSLPHAIQYNKRDLPDLLSVEEMQKECNPFRVQHFESIATEGPGVFDTLKSVAKEVLKKNQQE